MIPFGNWTRLQLQLAGSALVGGALGVLVRLAIGVDWSDAMVFALPLAFAGAPLSFSARFVCRALPLTRTPMPRLLLVAAGSAVVAGILWAAAGYGWWAWLTRGGLEPSNARMPTLVALVAGLGGPLYLFSVAMHYLVQAFHQSADASQRMLASEVAHRDAELRALRAQLDPHFLFNSLNSVAALTTADPVRARAMCQLLSDFLRETLAVGSVARIPLAREVALAEQYLRVEQMRFGRRLHVSTSIAADTADVPVPPLILQPLVENAVRHGIATCVDGGTIEIAVRRTNDGAAIAVRNPKDADAGPAGMGKGLDLVRRRLTSTFGGRATLSIASTPGAYDVSVALPVIDDTGVS